MSSLPKGPAMKNFDISLGFFFLNKLLNKQESCDYDVPCRTYNVYGKPMGS